MTTGGTADLCVFLTLALASKPCLACKHNEMATDAPTSTQVLEDLNKQHAAYLNGDTKAREAVVAAALKLVQELEHPGESIVRITWAQVSIGEMYGSASDHRASRVNMLPSKRLSTSMSSNISRRVRRKILLNLAKPHPAILC